MEEFEHMAGRFWQTANAYLNTAKLAYDAEAHPNMLFPCLHNMGHSLELFLKSHLICGNKSTKTIKTHDLDSLWHKPEISNVRSRAHALLEDYRKDKGIVIHMMTAMTLQDDCTMDDYVSLLSTVFTSDSDYALRYPPKFVTAPEPDELLSVLPRLYRAEPPLEVLRR